MSTRTKHLAAAYAPEPVKPPKPSEGTASAQRINAAPLPVRCPYFPACTYPEGDCADLCTKTAGWGS